MKLWKNLLCFIVSVWLVFGEPVLVFASGDNEPEGITDSIYMTSEHQEKIEELKKKVDDYVNSNISTYSGVSGRLNVPLYQQTKTNNCSSACIQMVVNYLSASPYEQEDIMDYQKAKYLKEWTYVYAVTGTLNHYVGGYEHIRTSDIAFTTAIQYSIGQNRPIICQVNTAELPNYTDGKGCNHYVVATGYYFAYSGSSYRDEVYYNDPHYDEDYFGRFTCTAAQMSSCINAHSKYYIGSA